MKFVLILLLAVASAGNIFAADTPRLLPKVDPLPLALSKDFEFRKTKLFWLGEPRKPRKNMFTTTNPGIAEASMNFESTYRMYGAITDADKHQRMGLETPGEPHRAP
jgi:hypothetical protein